jgi:hypothetical protein
MTRQMLQLQNGRLRLTLPHANTADCLVDRHTEIGRYGTGRKEEAESGGLNEAGQSDGRIGFSRTE